MGFSGRADVSGVGGAGIFRAQITDCKFVNRKQPHGIDKMLRFRLTWVLDWNGLKIGESIGGCLAYRWFDKKLNDMLLIWSPPKTRSGAHYHQNVMVSPDWYDIVKKKIESSGYVQYIGPSTDFLEDLKQKHPHTIDPNLPLTLKMDDEELMSQDELVKNRMCVEDFLETSKDNEN